MFICRIFCAFIFVAIFYNTFGKKFHHKRHVHRRHKDTNDNDCKEPLDFVFYLIFICLFFQKTRLMSEKIEEMYDDEATDIMDEYLNASFLPSDSDEKICLQAPAMAINSSVMDRSLCPWKWT